MGFRVSTLSTLLLVFLVCACSGQQTAQVAAPVDPTEDEQTLFSDVEDPGNATIPDEPTIVRGRFVNVNLDLLLEEDGSPTSLDGGLPLIANLFEDVQLVVTLAHVEPNAVGGHSWTGLVEGIEHSQVTLVVVDEVMMGNFTLPPTFYQVRSIGEGLHATLEIDQSAFPPEMEPIPAGTP